MTHPAESVRAECPVEHPLLLRLALLCGECHFQPVQGIPWQRKTPQLAPPFISLLSHSPRLIQPVYF
jgi:hypothetical protein